ncbi:hypothetical protein [Cellulomonas alba]|uniref:Replication initiation protein n=1 Tax=Cellulomonas alba TaxID=3053467 RepID=A0ABT7SKG3_9CELL|nr:hypothetical protein [Cellulomonas alba]MDM7856668.1 hypothetical protein [Cellulomonas alba]
MTRPAHTGQDTPRDLDAYLAFRELVERAAPRRQLGLLDVKRAVLAVRDGLALEAAADPYSAQLTFRLAVSPGTAQLRVVQVGRMDQGDGLDASQLVEGFASPELSAPVQLELEGVASTRRAVTHWSAKSRSRMFRTVPTLDFSEWTDGTLGMVTLTLPGWWEIVTPTGARLKYLLERLRLRFRHAGIAWVGLWKLEFQRRGAPHVHALMRFPALVGGVAFEDWLSRTWADVVLDSLSERDAFAYIDMGEYDRHVAAGTGIDYSGTRFSDPRRIATYFLGHSAKTTDGKEYQHVVPAIWRAQDAGPGRFWGYWGLRPGVVELDVPKEDYVQLRRVLRHVHRARAARHAEQAARYGLAIRRHPLRSLGASGGGLSGGTVVVNDGVQLARDLARFLELRRPWVIPSGVGPDGRRVLARLH